ncbi:DegV family protein [Clostridium sp. 'deep sea']|uniref:DegV family protein n=1 Tax=Clostridium sp. 'deep sea' TaxID=2779445 RepID=UPI00189666BA|nr:DegV family protein [Clostridium sp. 'deep sea']QOR35289.1 DegV family protein [Clostridium sp. 'deep sea']
MSIKLITDSSADLPKELLQSYNIGLIPLTVHMDDEEFFDCIDITPEEFFEKLDSLKTMPKTSQVSPQQFVSAFEKDLKEYDEIICVTISSNASGTYQSAVLAKNEVGSDRIHVVDSYVLSMGTGLLVLEIADLIKEGKTVNEILAKVESIKSRIDQRFTVDSLEYLQKGGRIKKSSMVIGKLLNIIPILSVEDGLTVAIKKTRSYKGAFRFYKDFVNESPVKRICIGHGNDIEKAMKLKQYFDKELSEKHDFIISNIGATIGCHAGPGVLHVAIVREE